MLEYIKKVDRFGMLNSHLEQEYSDYNAEACYDKEVKMNYVYDESKKIYFPNSYDMQRVKQLYACLKREQDYKSPHKYIDDDDLHIIREQKARGKKCICLDLGSMEGMFALSLADEVDEMHLFECDAEWNCALKQTFKPWDEKTKVISKFVSEKTFDNYICIDDYLVDRELDNVFLIVKMDIEGYERFALSGMKKL